MVFLGQPLFQYMYASKLRLPGTRQNQKHNFSNLRLPKAVLVISHALNKFLTAEGQKSGPIVPLLLNVCPQSADRVSEPLWQLLCHFTLGLADFKECRQGLAKGWRIPCEGACHPGSVSSRPMRLVFGIGVVLPLGQRTHGCSRHHARSTALSASVTTLRNVIVRPKPFGISGSGGETPYIDGKQLSSGSTGYSLLPLHG